MTPEKILLNKFGCVDRYQLFEKYEITHTQLDIIISAMEDYTKQKLNIANIMQAEGSDVSEEAAVGNSAAGQSGSDGFCYSWIALGNPICKEQCERCKKGGDLRGGSAKEALLY